MTGIVRENGLPPVAIVFDMGSASPLQIMRAAKNFCQPHFVVPTHLELNLRNLLVRVGGNVIVARDDGTLEGRLPHGISSVTTFSEGQLELTSRIAVRYGWPHNPPEVVESLADKSCQRSVLSRAGVDSTNVAVISAARDIEGAWRGVGSARAVLKPARGGGGRAVTIVDSPGACSTAMRRYRRGGRWLLEEYLEGYAAIAGDEWGDFVSVDAVSVDGRHELGALLGKLPLVDDHVETGSMLPATIDAQWRDSTWRLVRSALSALGVRTGVTHTEVKLTASGPRLIEVNGRLGGGVAELVEPLTGGSPVRWALAAALGQREDVRRYRGGNGVSFKYMVRRESLSGLPAAGVLLRGLRAVDGVSTVRLTGPLAPRESPTKHLPHLAEVIGLAPNHKVLLATLDSLRTVSREATAH